MHQLTGGPLLACLVPAGPLALPLSNRGASADNAATNQRPDRDPFPPRGDREAGPTATNPDLGRPKNEVIMVQLDWSLSLRSAANQKTLPTGQERARNRESSVFGNVGMRSFFGVRVSRLRVHALRFPTCSSLFPLSYCLKSTGTVFFF